MTRAANAICQRYRESFLSPLDFLASAFVTLLVVVDPLGLATIFLAVTGGLSPRERLHVSTRACFFAFTILAGAAIIGDQLLDALGISLPAFRIAGGLLLFSIASEMVFGVRIQREAKTAAQALEEHVHNVAAFPLAIPLMAGPGAITATLLLAGKAHGDIMLLVMLIGVIAAVCIVCFAVYQLAGRVRAVLWDVWKFGARQAAWRVARLARRTICRGWRARVA